MVASEASLKRALRAETRSLRQNMTHDQREHARAALTSHLQELVSRLGAQTIGAYLSTVDEPPTRDFLDWALANEIQVLLPVSREDGLLDWAHYDGSSDGVDAAGMPIPQSAIVGPIAVDSVDLMLIPAARVDRTGARLGWGRGYFDRLLGSMAKRPPVYAVVYDFDVVESVPREDHDQGVDGAVTPSGILRFVP